MIIQPLPYPANVAIPVSTSGLFNNGVLGTANIGLSANELMVTKCTNRNPLLSEGVWNKLAVRLGTGISAGMKFRLCVYDASNNLKGQTAEYVCTGSESSTVIQLDLLTPLAGPAYGEINWLGVHIESAMNISVSAFSAGSNNSRRNTTFAYASGAPASIATLGGVQDHTVMVWAGVTIDYGIIGAWESSVVLSDDSLTISTSANEMSLIRIVMPAGTGATRHIDRMYVRVDTITAGDKFRPVIYTSDGVTESTMEPRNLIAEGTEATVAASLEDLAMDISADLVEGTAYWLGVICSGVTDIRSQAGADWNARSGTGRTYKLAHTYANSAPASINPTTHELDYAAIWARYL